MSGVRNIAAPFQAQPAEGSHKRKEADSARSPLAPTDYIDYTNSSFIPLEPVPSLTLDKYCGPTPESNWVIPDRLLVGAYPASQSDVETFELLISILKLKTTTFVCLQQEYRTHGITEAMWRSGHALRPYFEDVKLIIKNKAMFKSLSEHPGVVDPQNLDFVHFPIRDCSISDDAAVLKLSQSLVARMDKGERLYLHCWGGHGRTGTVVCIMLHLMYGMSAKDAMAYCQRAHDLRQCPVNVGSPQTETQRDQVTRVVAALIQHRRSQAAAVAVGPPPKTVYPPVNTATEPTQSEKSRDKVDAAPPVKKQSSHKDVAGITQSTREIALEPAGEGAGTHAAPARNNIAARTTGHPVRPSGNTGNPGVAVSINVPGTSLGMIASPPSTPPASSSGKRGGRNVSYTVSTDQSMAAKPQASPPSPTKPDPEGVDMPTVEMTETEAPSAPSSGGETQPAVSAQSALPALRRTGSNLSRPTSPSPLITQKSSQKIELHPHVVNIEAPMAVQQGTSSNVTSTPPGKDQERLKSIPSDLVEGKTVIPHVGLYPMVRMPTERMKNDLGMGVSPPGSREGRRRGSRSVAPNLSTVSDAMEMSPAEGTEKDTQLEHRRMSAGTIMAHNIIMNAASQGQSPKSTAGVPVTTPPYEGESQDTDEQLKSDPMHISRMRSNTSEGHTSNSTRSVDASEEGSSRDFGEASAFLKNGSKKSLSAEGNTVTAEDDSAMDIDTESVRPAAATAIKAAPPVLSSGASTFTMGFNKKN